MGDVVEIACVAYWGQNHVEMGLRLRAMTCWSVMYNSIYQQTPINVVGVSLGEVSLIVNVTQTSKQDPRSPIQRMKTIESIKTTRKRKAFEQGSCQRYFPMRLGVERLFWYTKGTTQTVESTC